MKKKEEDKNIKKNDAVREKSPPRNFNGSILNNLRDKKTYSDKKETSEKNKINSVKSSMRDSEKKIRSVNSYSNKSKQLKSFETKNIDKEKIGSVNNGLRNNKENKNIAFNKSSPYLSDINRSGNINRLLNKSDVIKAGNNVKKISQKSYKKGKVREDLSKAKKIISNADLNIINDSNISKLDCEREKENIAKIQNLTLRTKRIIP